MIYSIGAARIRKLVAAIWRGRGIFQISAAGVFACAALIVLAQPALAQFSQQGSKLVGNGYSGQPYQGVSVAVSADGNTALVGGEQDNGDTGAVWVFIRSGDTWTQQGGKLVGSGYSGVSTQGRSVALSADGNTALVGGYEDNGGIGAVWVFIRSGDTWTQQGGKLVGSGYYGAPYQGVSVALSADGNTALVGGEQDNGGIGAAWVFTRSNGVWTQQGGKLVGSGYSGASAPEQANSVALSADGNTALVGGAYDNRGIGAAWVFTRSNGVWTQQGGKLVGSGEGPYGPLFGFSVALSGDGNAAIIGAPLDNSYAGAAWVFTRDNGVWTQQGNKLTGSGEETGGGNFGYSVALSADGNTALVGGEQDNGDTGAAWVFTRSSGVWTQQGNKLTGSGEAAGGGEFGFSVALSGDGNTAIIGAPLDNSYVGAAWVFIRAVPTNTHDFNDDGVSDVLWSDTSGDLAMWLMSGGQMSSGATLGNVGGSWSVVGQRDFNGDGSADILWSDGAGDVGLWLMDGTSVSSYVGLGNVGTAWQVAGTGDFNGDGTGDILWHNTSTGDYAIWFMSNGQYASGLDLGIVQSAWQVAGTGDFNGDGTTDILWYNSSTDDVAIWFMSSEQVSSAVNLGSIPGGGAWSVVGTGDFNGDGTSDILWRDSAGDLAIWLMSNGQFSSGATIAQVPTPWSVAETGDFDGDGKSDILWTDTSGDVGVWLMNGTTVNSALGLGNVGTAWSVQGQNAD